MSIRPALLAVFLVAIAAHAACGTVVVGSQVASTGSGGGHPGSGGTTSTGATGGTGTTGSTGGTGTTGSTGGGANCATCTAGQRCDVLQPCLFPPALYVCVPCLERPYCGVDGKIYDSDCAAIAAGQTAGFTCPVPAGFYRCGASFCNATTEDCGTFDPVPQAGFSESRCVPCATTPGRACGDDGKVYDSVCALLQAGHLRGVMCPGFILCGGAACDTTTSSCVMGEIADCEGGSPVWSCQLGVDAGG